MRRIALLSVVIVGLGAFSYYAYRAWEMAHALDIARLGQFGDSFGCWTSIFTLIALLGLLWQIWQTEKHHQSDRRREAKEHREEMNAQAALHRDEMKAQEVRHREMLAEQRRQHDESIKIQQQQHREDLEVQRMGFLSAEHPLLLTNPCALTLFSVDLGHTLSDNTSYILVWQFHLCDKVVPRNPLFSCSLISGGSQFAFGRCRPGQLPFSQSDMFEVVIPLQDVKPANDDTECTMAVLFQNSLGGCFKYSETYKIADLKMPIKSVPVALLNSALSESITMCHSVSKSFLSQGFAGKSFVRTIRPICDKPITATEYQNEVREIASRPYDESRAICQNIVDEQKLVKNLRAYLAQT